MSKSRVVLIAGWGQQSAVFESLVSLVEQFANATTTSVYELANQWLAKGNELTTDVPPVAISNYAQQLCDACLDIKPVTLVGWSMGAMVALEAANRFAKAVDRLILIGGCASFCDRTDEFGSYQIGISVSDVQSMSTELASDRQRTLGRFLLRCYNRTTTRQVMSHKTQQSMTLDAKVLQHGLEYLQQADQRSILNQITQPTLILHGEQDQVLPTAAAHFMHKYLPRSQTKIYANGSHALCEQFDEQVAEHIKDFLANGE